MRLELSVNRVVVGLLTALLGVVGWLGVASSDALAPQVSSPRPASCAPGPRAVDLHAAPWPDAATGHFETALSLDGCLRLRERRLLSRRTHWRVLELQPDGAERVVLEVDLAWSGAQVGSALVLQQPWAPEPMPTEWPERDITRLAWFEPGVHTERFFDAERREVREVRTTAAGVERRVVVLPAHNGERNPQGPRERHPDH